MVYVLLPFAQLSPVVPPSPWPRPHPRPPRNTLFLGTYLYALSSYRLQHTVCVLYSIVNTSTVYKEIVRS
jgi:hypothetical protein